MFLTTKPNRLTLYDYTQPGFYFVTVCTQDRMCHLGAAVHGEIALNSYGKTVERYWLDIPQHYKCVDIDPVYIVMPNHLHGIVIINPVGADIIRPAFRAVSNRPYSNTSLSTIMSSFKKAVSKSIHRSLPGFEWQKSFYDHVIRKDESLDKIREYIRNNPLKWGLDRNNPSNLWM